MVRLERQVGRVKRRCASSLLCALAGEGDPSACEGQVEEAQMGSCGGMHTQEQGASRGWWGGPQHLLLEEKMQSRVCCVRTWKCVCRCGLCLACVQRSRV